MKRTRIQGPLVTSYEGRLLPPVVVSNPQETLVVCPLASSMVIRSYTTGLVVRTIDLQDRITDVAYNGHAVLLVATETNGLQSFHTESWAQHSTAIPYLMQHLQAVQTRAYFTSSGSFYKIDQEGGIVRLHENDDQEERPLQLLAHEEFCLLLYASKLLVYRHDTLLQTIKAPWQESFVLVALGATNLACALASGPIQIRVNQIGIWRSNGASQKPITRKLRWHSQAATCLEFDGDTLYSGGIEAVLVVWEITGSTLAPELTLPRLAQDALYGIHSNQHIMLHSRDNTLQVYTKHNQSRLWKLEGLAGGYDTRTCMELVDGLLYVSGAQQHPGAMQLVDPATKKVVDTLEVVEYNRISAKESGESIPAPKIIQACWNKNHTVLVTVDEVYSEILSMGKILEEGLSCVTTLRFWRLVESRFQPTAAMAAPHGIDYQIQAAALSPCGKYCCTVSSDEKAFRVWVCKGQEWKGRFRVDIPMGFAELPTGPNGAAFSQDSKQLLIAFGRHITIWDHATANLINTVYHAEPRTDCEHVIDDLQMVQAGTMVNLILARSELVVSFQKTIDDPVGLEPWDTQIQSEDQDLMRVNDTVAVDDWIILVLLYDARRHKTSILSFGMFDHGDHMEDKEIEVDGEAIRLVVDNHDNNRVLYLLMASGEICKLEASDAEPTGMPLEDNRMDTNFPTLPLEGLKPIKELPIITLADLLEEKEDVDQPAPKRFALDRFGAYVGDTTHDDDALPDVTGAFGMAFVARHLTRQRWQFWGQGLERSSLDRTS